MFEKMVHFQVVLLLIHQVSRPGEKSFLKSKWKLYVREIELHLKITVFIASSRYNHRVKIVQIHSHHEHSKY